jgi:hypothetical protein
VVHIVGTSTTLLMLLLVLATQFVVMMLSGTSAHYHHTPRTPAATLVDHPIASSSYQPLYLDGQWTATNTVTSATHQGGTRSAVVAVLDNVEVPGDILTDLQRAGRIPDPYFNTSWQEPDFIARYLFACNSWLKQPCRCVVKRHLGFERVCWVYHTHSLTKLARHCHLTKGCMEHWRLDVQ